MEPWRVLALRRETRRELAESRAALGLEDSRDARSDRGPELARLVLQGGVALYLVRNGFGEAKAKVGSQPKGPVSPSWFFLRDQKTSGYRGKREGSMRSTVSKASKSASVERMNRSPPSSMVAT